MKVNLEKELRTGSEEIKRNLNHEEVALDEIKGLLEYKTQEDSFIINNLGFNSLNAKMQEDKGKLIIMNNIEKATNLTVVRVETIRALCEKYRLRFLRTINYVGIIPTDITTDIKALEESKRQSHAKFQKFDEHDLKNEFFILAPAKMFKLKPREKQESIYEKAWVSFKNSFKVDPILFYKQDDEHYVIVRKWGNDFTIFRRILGLITKNETNLAVTLFSTLLIICGFLTKLPHIEISVATLLIGACVIGPILANTHDNFYTRNNWNSSTE